MLSVHSKYCRQIFAWSWPDALEPSIAVTTWRKNGLTVYFEYQNMRMQEHPMLEDYASLADAQIDFWEDP